jgi:membrane protein
LLLKQAGQQWMAHKAGRMGAALSYYSIFSLGPIILIAVSIAGVIFGREAVQDQVSTSLKELLGEKGAGVIIAMLQSASQPQQGVLAGAIGLATLILAAIGVVVQLKDAFNTIWEVESTKTGGVWAFIRSYIFSFAAVISIGFLLLTSMVMTAGIAVIGKFVNSFVPEVALQATSFLVSFSILTLLFSLMFRWMPDAFVSWSDVWLAAIITAGLFEIGKLIIGLYIGKQGLESTFGAASSLVVVLIWVYYSAQIVLYGAELSAARAKFRTEALSKNNANP